MHKLHNQRMDDIVKAAMAKWPTVPHCYGWLGLDARGNWYMRDDAAQAAGPFALSKGSLLRHDKLIDFIARNYQAETQGATAGQWYFQNGPQRVYVELAATPLIWRLDAQFAPTSHIGQRAVVHSCVVDEDGFVYLHTELGLGLVHTQDVGLAADAIEQSLWTLTHAQRANLPHQFGFVLSPQAARSLA